MEQKYNTNQTDAKLHRLHQRKNSIQNRIILLMESNPDDLRIKELQGMLHRMNTNQRIISESGYASE